LPQDENTVFLYFNYQFKFLVSIKVYPITIEQESDCLL
jgi:hypothetical protein